MSQPNETTKAAPLSCEELAAELGVHADSVRLWALRGVKVNGFVVHLDCIHAGNQYRFTRAAIERFTEACRLAKLGRPAPPHPVASKTDGRAIGLAALDKM